MCARRGYACFRDPWLWFLFIAQTALRLPLINWHSGEYTDGILQLTLFANENRYYPPLYALTALPWTLTGMDLLTAGRLVSILAASLTVWPAALLGHQLAGRRGAVTAAMLWCAVPMAHRWALHGMSDALFTFWMACAAVAFGAAVGERKTRGSFFFIAFSGLAALTKVQGCLLAPGVVFVLGRLLRMRGARLVDYRLAAALAPWLALAGWWMWRGLAVGAIETKRFDAPPWQLAQAFAAFGWGFLRWLPSGMGHGVAVCAVWGWWTLRRRQAALFHASWLLFVLLWLLHTWQLSFQLRYFLPVIPLACAWAAGAMIALSRACSWRPALPLFVAIVMGWGLSGSAAVIEFQRHTWGALATAARMLRDLPVGTRIFGDEYYDAANPPNIKLRYFAGRDDVLFLYEQVPGRGWSLRRDLRPGDVIVLNNLSSNIPAIYQGLSSQFHLGQIGGSSVVLRPLLPDVMSAPNPALTNRPECMNYRHVPQIYDCVIYQLEGRTE